MNTTSYLKRIAYTEKPEPTLETLYQLHRNHVMNVPFENLDIHLGREIKLDDEHIYHKVVNDNRGGFCYEVNYLFHLLLKHIGYRTDTISARVIDTSGNPGPLFDHLCIRVELETNYLADVGFGDLFLQPLRIEPGIQFDGRHYFTIEPTTDNDFVLSMSPDKTNFVPKYTFSTRQTSLDLFADQCRSKQISQDSYFVQNIVCTRATPDGRETIFNDKYIVTKDGQKREELIADEKTRKELLRSRFDISW